MKGNRSKNLPTFKSLDELVAFFEAHDMGEYLEKLPTAEFEVRLKKRVSTEKPLRKKTSGKGVSLKSKNHSSVDGRKK